MSGDHSAEAIGAMTRIERHLWGKRVQLMLANPSSRYSQRIPELGLRGTVQLALSRFWGSPSPLVVVSLVLLGSGNSTVPEKVIAWLIVVVVVACNLASLHRYFTANRAIRDYQIREGYRSDRSAPEPSTGRVFKPRLRVLYVLLGVAMVSSLFVVLVAIVGESNAHNPNGLSPSVRAVGLVLGIGSTLALGWFWLRVARTYVRVSPSFVEIRNYPRRLTLGSEQVEGFSAGVADVRGRRPVMVVCNNGTRIGMSAMGRFDTLGFDKSYRELMTAMGRDPGTPLL